MSDASKAPDYVRSVDFPYFCVNCTECPTRPVNYFNPALKSNYHFWSVYHLKITSVLRGYCPTCDALVEFVPETFITDYIV